jgi:hypothetical protein
MANAMTKDNNTLSRKGEARKANKGMARKQPSKRSEISIQTVMVSVIQSGLMGTMAISARVQGIPELPHAGNPQK